jgi:hypothetical protein
LHYELESLKGQDLPTTKIVVSLDSVNKFLEATIQGFNEKLESIKSQTTEKLKTLTLPGELEERAASITSKIEGFKMPTSDLTISSLNLADNPLSKIGVSVPELESLVESPAVKLSEIASLPQTDLADIGSHVEQYQPQMSQIPTDLDQATKLVEDLAVDNSPMADVGKELGQVDEITRMAGNLQDQEELKQQLVEKVQQEVVDHFAEQKEQLQKSMESLTKLKQKFASVTSLRDLPKRPPNEMKGKPIRDRLVPGVSFQLYKRDDDVLLDVNPYVGFRITKRLTVGAGWNERVGYNFDAMAWSPEKAHIYGPRLFSEYKLNRGFTLRGETEIMNTYVPPYAKLVSIDPGNRQGIWGAFAGIKKDYKLMGKVRGTAMVMVRLFDAHFKSPYLEVINARFGVELPLKKN